MVMNCSQLVSYSIMINGQRCGSIKPTMGCDRGARFLLIYFLCVEGFSSLLHKAKTQGVIQGVKVVQGAHSVNHLLFMDDILVFCEATGQGGFMS